MLFMHPSPLSGFFPTALRVSLAISLALSLSIVGIRSANAQVIYPGFPYGEIELAEAKLICTDSLIVYGNIDQIIGVAYGFVPSDTAHVGISADIFVALRLHSEPGKLWLITNEMPRSLTEYDASKAQLPSTYWQSPFTLSHLNWIYPFSSRTPTDLSHLVGDAEVLVGYGLRQGESSTTVDSFQEMLDSQRFQVVWRVGQPSELQTCFEYHKLRVTVPQVL